MDTPTEKLAAVKAAGMTVPALGSNRNVSMMSTRSSSLSLSSSSGGDRGTSSSSSPPKRSSMASSSSEGHDVIEHSNKRRKTVETRDGSSSSSSLTPSKKSQFDSLTTKNDLVLVDDEEPPEPDTDPETVLDLSSSSDDDDDTAHPSTSWTTPTRKSRPTTTTTTLTPTKSKSKALTIHWDYESFEGSLVGYRIRIFNVTKEKWNHGRVLRYDAYSNKHKVRFDDDDDDEAAPGSSSGKNKSSSSSKTAWLRLHEEIVHHGSQFVWALVKGFAWWPAQCFHLSTPPPRPGYLHVEFFSTEQVATIKDTPDFIRPFEDGRMDEVLRKCKKKTNKGAVAVACAEQRETRAVRNEFVGYLAGKAWWYVNRGMKGWLGRRVEFLWNGSGGVGGGGGETSGRGSSKRMKRLVSGVIRQYSRSTKMYLVSFDLEEDGTSVDASWVNLKGKDMGLTFLDERKHIHESPSALELAPYTFGLDLDPDSSLPFAMHCMACLEEIEDIAAETIVKCATCQKRFHVTCLDPTTIVPENRAEFTCERCIPCVGCDRTDIAFGSQPYLRPPTLYLEEGVILELCSTCQPLYDCQSFCPNCGHTWDEVKFQKTQRSLRWFHRQQRQGLEKSCVEIEDDEVEKEKGSGADGDDGNKGNSSKELTLKDDTANVDTTPASTGQSPHPSTSAPPQTTPTTPPPSSVVTPHPSWFRPDSTIWGYNEGSMLICDSCNLWVHAGCANFTKSDYELTNQGSHPIYSTEFLCRSCCRKRCEKILKEMESDDSMRLFAVPVTIDVAPTYSDVISDPMDLQTMSRRVAKGDYFNYAWMRESFELMVFNALTFNRPHTIYWNEAKRYHEVISLKLYSTLLKAAPMTKYTSRLTDAYSKAETELSHQLSRKKADTTAAKKDALVGTDLALIKLPPLRTTTLPPSAGWDSVSIYADVRLKPVDARYNCFSDTCFRCGSSGSADTFLFCVDCAEAYHCYCVNPSGGRCMSEWGVMGWRCPNCKCCEITGVVPEDEGRLIYCEMCDGAFTLDLLKPKLEKVPEGLWICGRCVVCRECEGGGKRVSSEYWSRDPTLCFKCGGCEGLLDEETKKRKCGVCEKLWREGDEDLVKCDFCDVSVHIKCDPIAVYFKESGGYECPNCQKVMEEKWQAHMLRQHLKEQSKTYIYEERALSPSDDIDEYRRLSTEIEWQMIELWRDDYLSLIKNTNALYEKIIDERRDNDRTPLLRHPKSSRSIADKNNNNGVLMNRAARYLRQLKREGLEDDITTNHIASIFLRARNAAAFVYVMCRQEKWEVTTIIERWDKFKSLLASPDSDTGEYELPCHLPPVSGKEEYFVDVPHDMVAGDGETSDADGIVDVQLEGDDVVTGDDKMSNTDPVVDIDVEKGEKKPKLPSSSPCQDETINVAHDVMTGGDDRKTVTDPGINVKPENSAMEQKSTSSSSPSKDETVNITDNITTDEVQTSNTNPVVDLERDNGTGQLKTATSASPCQDETVKTGCNDHKSGTNPMVNIEQENNASEPISTSSPSPCKDEIMVDVVTHDDDVLKVDDRKTETGPGIDDVPEKSAMEQNPTSITSPCQDETVKSGNDHKSDTNQMVNIEPEKNAMEQKPSSSPSPCEDKTVKIGNDNKSDTNPMVSIEPENSASEPKSTFPPSPCQDEALKTGGKDHKHDTNPIINIEPENSASESKPASSPLPCEYETVDVVNHDDDVMTVDDQKTGTDLSVDVELEKNAMEPKPTSITSPCRDKTVKTGNDNKSDTNPMINIKPENSASEPKPTSSSSPCQDELVDVITHNDDVLTCDDRKTDTAPVVDIEPEKNAMESKPTSSLSLCEDETVNALLNMATCEVHKSDTNLLAETESKDNTGKTNSTSPISSCQSETVKIDDNNKSNTVPMVCIEPEKSASEPKTTTSLSPCQDETVSVTHDVLIGNVRKTDTDSLISIGPENTASNPKPTSSSSPCHDETANVLLNMATGGDRKSRTDPIVDIKPENSSSVPKSASSLSPCQSDTIKAGNDKKTDTDLAINIEPESNAAEPKSTSSLSPCQSDTVKTGNDKKTDTDPVIDIEPENSASEPKPTSSSSSCQDETVNDLFNMATSEDQKNRTNPVIDIELENKKAEPKHITSPSPCQDEIIKTGNDKKINTDPIVDFRSDNSANEPKSTSLSSACKDEGNNQKTDTDPGINIEPENSTSKLKPTFLSSVCQDETVKTSDDKKSDIDPVIDIEPENTAAEPNNTSSTSPCEDETVSAAHDMTEGNDQKIDTDPVVDIDSENSVNEPKPTCEDETLKNTKEPQKPKYIYSNQPKPPYKPRPLLGWDTLLTNPSTPPWKDPRICCLCHTCGDIDAGVPSSLLPITSPPLPTSSLSPPGRLLPLFPNLFVHAHCALWSSEVWESTGGLVNDVEKARYRGSKLKCFGCGRNGATLGCHKTNCSSNYHYPCARARGAVFTADRRMYCQKHKDEVTGDTAYDAGGEPMRTLTVVSGKGADDFGDGLEKRCFRVGTLVVHSLGEIEQDYDGFHDEDYIMPPGFMSTRIFWSFKKPLQRTLYINKIDRSNTNNRPIFSITPADDPHSTITAHTPTQAYNTLYQKVITANKPAFSQNDLFSPLPMRRGPSVKVAFTLNAPQFFGYAYPHIRKALERLPGVVATVVPLSPNSSPRYQFSFKRPTEDDLKNLQRARAAKDAEKALENRSGCARTEGVSAVDRSCGSGRITRALVRTAGEEPPQQQQRSGRRGTYGKDTGVGGEGGKSGSKKDGDSIQSMYREMKSIPLVERLSARRSHIHGWGLFTKVDIPKDHMIVEYMGEVVRQCIADKRERAYEMSGIGSCYMFRLDSSRIVDATTVGCMARFMNHSCCPNAYARVVTVDWNGGLEKKIVVFAMKDITAGEEITYDYKFPVEDGSLRCMCGAPMCVGRLN